MLCKWCGMESEDDKRCDWCGRPFASPPGDQATTEVPEATTTIPETTTAMSPVDADPAVGVPFSPRVSTMKPMRVGGVEIIPFGVRFEKYLGVMTILLAAGMAVSHYLPGAWLGPFLALLFMSGLLLGSCRVVGYYDDEFSDVLILLAVTMFVGPVYATVAYLFVSFLRQDANFSLVGLMASYVAIRLAIGSAAHGFVDTINYMLTFQVSFDIIPRVLQLFPTCVLVGGWICASFTRPLNE